MSKLQEHIKENNEQYEHFNKRMNQFADFLQSAMNPTVTLKNVEDEDKEMFMGEAIVVIHNDLKSVKKSLTALDKRTEILDDFLQIKNNWTELKMRTRKFLKPIFKFIVYCSVLFIMVYSIIQVAAGKWTAKEAWDFFVNFFL
jgi:hypothetical protein